MADYSIAQRTNPLFHDLCCQLSILCKGETTIYSITGLDELRSLPQIIDLTTYYQAGQTIGKDGTTAQIFARIHVVVKDENELKEIKQQIARILSVQDMNGHSIIINTL